MNTHDGHRGRDVLPEDGEGGVGQDADHLLQPVLYPLGA